MIDRPAHCRDVVAVVGDPVVVVHVQSGSRMSRLPRPPSTLQPVWSSMEPGVAASTLSQST